MNKSEFIDAFYEANKRDIPSKAAAVRLVDSIPAIVEAEMAKGEAIRISGFGSLIPTKRGERKGVNPQTKEKMTIPAHNTVKFQAGKGILDAVASAKLK